MSPEKTDRRINRTQKMLHEALHQLMGQKRYDDITVQDIIDRADVGRSTFYAHYQDKEDLAVSGLREIMENLNQAIVESDPQGLQLLPTLSLFEHIAENPHVFKIMMRDRGMEFFFDKSRQFWAERLEVRLQSLLPPGREPVVPIPLIAAATAGTFMTILKWWLDNRMPYPPDRMAEMTDRLLLPGIWNALGIEPPSTG
jgi:AcrR family transcriptional regulator